MTVAELLRPLSEQASGLGGFRPIGAPGLLETNESTPEGFYEGLRQGWAPDGYIYGPGCGNVLSMLEAFAGTPRGLVLADTDPAVVLAAKVLVAGLVHHPRLEDFVTAFFCGGRSWLEVLEGEVLSGGISKPLRGHLEAHRGRMWAALEELTEGFSHAPGEVPELLARWEAHHPPRGRPIPVRTFLARNYDKLHRLAAGGDLAVVPGSLLDPAVIAAVAGLPGFGESTNVIYLSNVADHLRRRALLADARRSLMLVPGQGSEGPAIRSGEELLELLNREQMGRLEALARASRRVVFVRSIGIGGLTLEAHPELPRFTGEDFGSALDLRRMIPLFLLSVSRYPDPPPPWEGEELQLDPWRGARHHRAAVLGLWAAWIAGDRLRVHRGVEELTADLPRVLAAPISPAGPPFAVFWIAELCLLLLLLARSGGGRGVVTGQVRRRLAAAGSWLRRWRRELDTACAGRPGALLLAAQACAAAGALLEREELLRAGQELAAAARAVPRDGSVGERSEILLRSVLLALAARDRRVLEDLEGLCRGLLEAVAESGRLELEPVAGSPGEGYRGYLEDGAVAYENVRLGMLFHGLLTEESETIEGALMVDYHARHPGGSGVPEPDALLGALG